jgi:hypothetical protein
MSLDELAEPVLEDEWSWYSCLDPDLEHREASLCGPLVLEWLVY